MLTKQLIMVLTDIEVSGHCTIPVEKTLQSTIDSIHQLSHIYGIWLPDSSISYVFAKTGPNSTASENCTVKGLFRGNKIFRKR